MCGVHTVRLRDDKTGWTDLHYVCKLCSHDQWRDHTKSEYREDRADTWEAYLRSEVVRRVYPTACEEMDTEDKDGRS